MTRVWVDFTEPRYSEAPPFHADTPYPESPFPGLLGPPNPAYALVRRLFQTAGYDAAHFGLPEWNPLGGRIRPGQTVVLKPNFVLHRNQSGDDLFAVITHPSVLRAVADYVYIALRGQGRIIIADAPQMDCSWDALSERLRLDAVQALYRDRLGFDLDVLDLRPFELIDADQPAYSTNRRLRPGDPAGSVMINLGRSSAFHGLPSDRFYGADFNRRETIAHHHGDTHEYSVSGTILGADVFISIPKLKTHKKVGVTLNLKGLVGINTNKNCLIHYRLGAPRDGGDQLPDTAFAADRPMIRAQRKLFDLLLARQTVWGDRLYSALRAVYRGLIKPIRPISQETRLLDAGNWHGNDSAWRMTVDLARILRFADRNGTLHATPQRTVLSLIDGLIAGEGEGPLAPTARPAGAMLLGENLLAADLAATRLMGFDFSRLKQFSLLNDPADFGVRSPSEIEVFVRGEPVAPDMFFSPEWPSPLTPFAPHPGWVGQVELHAAHAPVKNT